MRIYVTFGQSHRHIVAGKKLDYNCIAGIQCTSEDRGKKMAKILFRNDFARFLNSNNITNGFLGNFSGGIVYIYQEDFEKELDIRLENADRRVRDKMEEQLATRKDQIFTITRILVYKGTAKFIERSLDLRAVKDKMAISDGSVTEAFLGRISTEEVYNELS